MTDPEPDTTAVEFLAALEAPSPTPDPPEPLSPKEEAERLIRIALQARIDKIQSYSMEQLLGRNAIPYMSWCMDVMEFVHHNLGAFVAASEETTGGTGIEGIVMYLSQGIPTYPLIKTAERHVDFLASHMGPKCNEGVVTHKTTKRLNAMTADATSDALERTIEHKLQHVPQELRAEKRSQIKSIMTTTCGHAGKERGRYVGIRRLNRQKNGKQKTHAHPEILITGETFLLWATHNPRAKHALIQLYTANVATFRPMYLQAIQETEAKIVLEMRHHGYVLPDGGVDWDKVYDHSSGNLPDENTPVAKALLEEMWFK